MNVSINITAGFKRQAKKLLKKYHSLNSDLSKLNHELLTNPEMGTPLGGAFKMMGESYHNNHHKHSDRPNFGVRWHEIDPTWIMDKMRNIRLKPVLAG